MQRSAQRLLERGAEVDVAADPGRRGDAGRGHEQVGLAPGVRDHAQPADLEEDRVLARAGAPEGQERRRIRREPGDEALAQRAHERRVAAVVRVVDLDRGRHGGIGESPRRVGVEREADVLDRGDAVLLALLRIEAGRDARLAAVRAESQRHVLVDPDEAVELRADARELLDLDEERRRELALAGHQLVVDVELVLHLRGRVDSLDLEHLLDLEAQGLAVLEEQADALADGEPARALVLDHAAPVLVAQPRVGLAVDDLLEAQRPHSAESP